MQINWAPAWPADGGPVTTALKAIAEPSVVIGNRASPQMAAFTGPPDFTRPPQTFYDSDVAAHPELYGRQIHYDLVLAVQDDGSPAKVDWQKLTYLTDEQKQFYTQYGFTDVPYLDPAGWTFAKADIASPNLPHTGTIVDPVELAWLKMPSYPIPLASPPVNTVLRFGFAGSVEVVNMDLWRRMNPVIVAANTGGDGFTSADRSLLQAVAQKLGV